MDRSGSAGGDLRLPVAITTRFVSDGETYSDTTLYDVGYRLDNGILDTDVELIGLSRIERTQPSAAQARLDAIWRSEEHTSELQSLMRISYAVFCLKKKIKKNTA